MAKLIYKYGTMNSGKSIELFKTVLNYEMAGKLCLPYTSVIDNRNEVGLIASRNGDKIYANLVNKDIYNEIDELNKKQKISCIVVDECQFLEETDIDNLADIVDYLGIPVICFGLLTDFRGKLFSASKRLIELADNHEMNKTICICCEKKATMNIRTVNKKAVYEGEQIQVGDSEYYPVCRRCYKDFDNQFKKVSLNKDIESIINKNKKGEMFKTGGS